MGEQTCGMVFFYIWSMDAKELYQIYSQFPSVQTDTRKIRPGDIFFALKGPHFNGNSFASRAIDNGAAYAIVDEEIYKTTDKIILVEDVLKSLQDLALFHRNQFDIPFIAITGSNGKTTTKELVHAVLSTSFKTYTTQGNLNNHIGIPLTILSVGKDAEMAVIEMGANHLKEIESYCRYTRPTHGLITNCGKAHLEGFGSEEGVRKGKGELFDYLKASGGTAFIMGDYDYLHEMSQGIPNVVSYGSKNANITGSIIQAEPFLQVKIEKDDSLKEINTQLVGSYNFPNVMAAVTIGKYFGVESSKIFSALASYAPSNSRSQLITLGTNRIILDAYNANPTSMRAAIENLAHLEAGEKVLLLGAMAELGKDSIREHQDLVDLIRRYSWKSVVLVGGDFLKISHPYISFPDAAEAASWFKQQDFSEAYILIKGSRSTGMEKILGE